MTKALNHPGKTGLYNSHWELGGKGVDVIRNRGFLSMFLIAYCVQKKRGFIECAFLFIANSLFIRSYKVAFSCRGVMWNLPLHLNFKDECMCWKITFSSGNQVHKFLVGTEIWVNSLVLLSKDTSKLSSTITNFWNNQLMKTESLFWLAVLDASWPYCLGPGVM